MPSGHRQQAQNNATNDFYYVDSYEVELLQRLLRGLKH